MDDEGVPQNKPIILVGNKVRVDDLWFCEVYSDCITNIELKSLAILWLFWLFLSNGMREYSAL